MSLQQASIGSSGLKNVPNSKLSLSTYFPKGTQFYYGYPAGEDSGFLNSVTPPTEELVASRPISCAGDDVAVVCFSATLPAPSEHDLYKALDIPAIHSSQIVKLPQDINIQLAGKVRNEAIKAQLISSVKPGRFVMAQPYTDMNMRGLYQISPDISAWFNDKANMSEYINSNLLPKSYGIYKSGAEFAEKYKKVTLPAVVKASSSSSGDGVYLCLTKKDLKRAAKKLKPILGTILAEEYIKIQKNYGLHFGIPHLRSETIDLIGINEQVVSPKGQFMGGFIESTDIPYELNEAAAHLMEDILPYVRAKGWYGIGGFDILVDDTGKAYFIDCNFRMTGMSAYHFLIANKRIISPLLSFSGEFYGNKEDFEKAILPFAGVASVGRFVHLIALSKNDNTWRLNGALCFDTPDQLQDRATVILNAGIRSDTLSQFSITGR